MAKWLDATELGNRSAYRPFRYDEHVSKWMGGSGRGRCVWKCVEVVGCVRKRVGWGCMGCMGCMCVSEYGVTVGVVIGLMHGG